jgi:alpha 1,2-mannosyltransferase
MPVAPEHYNRFTPLDLPNCGRITTTYRSQQADMAIARARARHKWALVATILLLLWSSLWYTDPGLTIPAAFDVSHSQSPLDQEHDNPSDSNLDLYHVPEHLKSQLLDLQGLDAQELQLDSDLHQIQTNDEFLPFIAAVSNVQNLSVVDAYGTCDYDSQELTSFRYHADSSWVNEPLGLDVIQPIREAWQHFVKHGLISWKAVEHEYNGRGIVIVGGGFESSKRIEVILRALRKYGTLLPIEISYFGDEMDDSTKQRLTAIYGPERLFFNDLSQADQTWRTYKSLMENYQLKTAGIINARFSEILLLDSDNIPTSDPASLFESSTYKEYGSVFWPDHPRTRREHPAWAIFNTPCRRDEYEFETGQLLVDKRRYFYHLQLAAWMNTQDYWREALLGDKDLFRYAWHGFKTRYGTPTKWLTSVGFVVKQSDESEGSRLVYCGHTFGQAYPDHKVGDPGSGIAFLHGGALKTMSAPLLARLRRLNGGIFTHFKRVAISTLEDWTQIEYDVGTGNWHTGHYFNSTHSLDTQTIVAEDDDFDLNGKSIGKERVAALAVTEEIADKAVLCMDFAHVEARPIGELGGDAEGFEELFMETGGYWMIEQNYRGW